MLLEAFLSFLGLGIQPPQTSWGLLISYGAETMEEYPWLLIFPGAALTLPCLLSIFWATACAMHSTCAVQRTSRHVTTRCQKSEGKFRHTQWREQCCERRQFQCGDRADHRNYWGVGSGKSVACYSLLGLIPQPPGQIAGGEAFFEDVDLLKLPERELRKIRGRDIAMIFQDPMTCLNPYMKMASS